MVVLFTDTNKDHVCHCEDHAVRTAMCGCVVR